MIKIEEFSVKGYKNIKDATLRLNNFNVIIGPNNSGKSNFIQSISFLNYLINSSSDELKQTFDTGFKHTHFKEIAPDFLTHKSFDKRSSGTIEFSLKIRNSHTERLFNYDLQIGWSSFDFNVSYEILKERMDVKQFHTPGKAKEIFERKGEKIEYGSDFSKTSIVETAPKSLSTIRILKLIATNHEDYIDAVNSLNTVIKAPIFYFSNTELSKPNSKEKLNEFNGRTVAFNLEDEIFSLEEDKSKWEIFTTVLNSILKIDFVHVIRIGGEDKKNKEHKFLYFTHMGVSKGIDQFSDGSILIIAIVVKILSSKEHIIFIEEPENSTHPKALIDLLAFFKSFSMQKQFIISSHSIALLNKTKVEDIIASCISEDGQSEFFNVSSRKELRNRLQKGYVNFSDELFFGDFQVQEEFQTD